MWFAFYLPVFSRRLYVVRFEFAPTLDASLRGSLSNHLHSRSLLAWLVLDLPRPTMPLHVVRFPSVYIIEACLLGLFCIYPCLRGLLSICLYSPCLLASLLPLLSMPDCVVRFLSASTLDACSCDLPCFCP